MRDTIKQEGLPYTQVVNEIIQDKSVSLKAIGLFTFMSHKAQMKGVKWNFTIRSMAKQMKDGEDSIRSGLQELKQLGWITYTKHTDGTGEYLLKASIKPKQENPDKALDSQNRETPRREIPMKGNSTPTNNKDSFHKKDSLPKKDIGRFDDFWQVYPIKKGKAKSQAKWNLKKLDSIADNLINDVLKRLKEDYSWIKDNGQFIVHPTTYLNGELWNDEMQPIPENQKPKGTFDSKSTIEKQLLAMKIKQQQGRLE